MCFRWATTTAPKDLNEIVVGFVSNVQTFFLKYVNSTMHKQQETMTFLMNDLMLTNIFSLWTKEARVMEFKKQPKMNMERGKTFQVAQITHEIFLILDHSYPAKYFFDICPTELSPSRQNLGPFLENKVIWKLKLSKNVFYKKIIFFNENLF